MRNRSEHDPNMIRAWSEHDPTTHETVSQPSHRRGRSSRFGDGLCMEKHRLSCICYLSKTHFVRDFLQNSIGNSSTSTTCNPIYSEGTILELQITMEFHRQLIHQHHLQPHLQCGNDPTVANHNGILSTAHARKTVETPFTMRNRSDHGPRMIRAWSENDPRMIRPHTRPSRNRRTADVDHRGSGTDFVWKNIGFRASAISQKPHFVRDFLQNSIGNSSTSTTCNPIYIAGTILQLQITMEFCRPHMHEKHLKPHLQCGTDPTMIRAWSEHDPTTHETVSQPSHRRGRSSRFGDGLCMEKHRLSCICYLSKTHFVRDFLQNSIGNSSTSTTCNPIYSEGTILELQITMEFHRQLIHQHHLQPHLQCGNDPTVANHNGILSTAHARKTVETPFTMRNRSDHGPRMIRAWSENDPRMIRPHTRPSRNRRTADVDHRGSGTDFVWKNIGFRASAISQKPHFVRDFLQNSIGNSSTSTLAIPFTLRERS